MSFNKNASKRLSIIAGIDRESREITDIISNISHNYLTKLLKRLINVVLFAGRKTIAVDDIRFLSQICPDQPTVACPSNLSNLTKACTVQSDLEEVLRGKRGYTNYTLKKPFNNLVRSITRDLYREEIRIGKNVVSILQSMTEQHIVTVMNHAATYTIRESRGTLLPRDIETALLFALDSST